MIAIVTWRRWNGLAMSGTSYLESSGVQVRLRMRERAGMRAPLFVMMRQHGALWDAMRALDALLAANTDADALLEPAAGCSTSSISTTQRGADHLPTSGQGADRRHRRTERIPRDGTDAGGLDLRESGRLRPRHLS